MTGTFGTLRLAAALSGLALASSAGFERVLLAEAAQKTGAVCLDGTPSAYYLSKGSGSGSLKWYIHHEGGGWCYDLQDCAQRSKTSLGSSKDYPAALDAMGQYFSEDAGENPMMHNWNKVYVKYCDGGSWTGANMTTTTVGDATLHFRGALILRALQQDLLSKGLSRSTDAVISGCSAGGLAAFLHLDSWAAALDAPGRKVVGMPDSGFFLAYESRTVRYRSHMEWVFHQQNSTSGVHPGCIAVHSRDGGNPAKCIFAEHTAPFIRTPLFALQAEYDSWQMGNVLDGGSNDSTINAWGQRLTELMQEGLFGVNPGHGVFLDSCAHHCVGGVGWDQITIGHKKASAAFQEWYEKGSTGLANKGIFRQAKAYPCQETCCISESDEDLQLASSARRTASLNLFA